ncbi:NAD(P)-dependent oxidoreductase [Lentibacillus sp. CBA3610]|uniref:NAD(P)-dependent oxidoreductase n=1 Tax=Lentibacillus sp. CBA3610 TaxID=2518176 RepID=UPI0015959253|nr:NAD(P)-dependent oxidoreductase [Lentibacillus sp. CBA3610]QKY68307.1 NAD(P)-dependent oxidoreductase [Lentibacillus sp. CBA3610]
MKIGLIGLGNMGGRVAKRLMRQGHQLSVYDINPELLSEFAKLGAKTADSPLDLAKSCHYIVTVLPNADVVKNVVLGKEGLITVMEPGSVLIDATSSVPDVTTEIGAALDKQGIRMLDAPISGGLQRAEEGDLAVMVGGDEATFTECMVIFNDIGSTITHVGKLGSGHTIKVLNNLISATTFAITAEALSIGIKKGLIPSKMLEVINHSTGRNNSSENKFPQHVLTRKFDVGFTMDLMCKDLTIATDIIRNEKSPAFISNTVYQLWQYAQSRSEEGADHSEYAKLIEEMYGSEITD